MRITNSGRKSVPLTVSVNPGPRAIALDGERLVTFGATGVELRPLTVLWWKEGLDDGSELSRVPGALWLDLNLAEEPEPALRLRVCFSSGAPLSLGAPARSDELLDCFDEFRGAEICAVKK
jgi:hypothetical protein